MIEKITKELLVSLSKQNVDTDPDFKETPHRVAKMYEHFFRDEDSSHHFEKKFPTNNNQIVIMKGIRAVGLCPHHLLPIEYKIHIGYIPDKWALGLSKLNRIARAVASYPKLQENMTDEICQLIQENLKPRGVIVVAEGVHGCMRFRGVEDATNTITSQIAGVFLDSSSTKAEFLDLIRMNG